MGGQFLSEKVGSHSYFFHLLNTLYFRYDDKYRLVLAFKDSKTGSQRETDLTKSVAHFVDVNGSVVHEIVENEVTKLHNSLLSERKDK
jgi:signal peptidase complex subunit 2